MKNRVEIFCECHHMSKCRAEKILKSFLTLTKTLNKFLIIIYQFSAYNHEKASVFINRKIICVCGVGGGRRMVKGGGWGVSTHKNIVLKSHICKNNHSILMKFYTHIAYIRYEIVYKFHTDT